MSNCTCCASSSSGLDGARDLRFYRFNMGPAMPDRRSETGTGTPVQPDGMFRCGGRFHLAVSVTLYPRLAVAVAS